MPCAYSRLLSRWSFCSPGGPGVQSSSLQLVGRLYNGRLAALCCVCGYGRWWAWRTIVSPTRGTPFPFQPLHAQLVRCLPACGWSVYGRVVASATVSLVHGSVGSHMVGLFAVGFFVLQPALAQPDVVLVVLVVCCGQPVGYGGHCVVTSACPARCWSAFLGL